MPSRRKSLPAFLTIRKKTVKATDIFKNKDTDNAFLTEVSKYKVTRQQSVRFRDEQVSLIKDYRGSSEKQHLQQQNTWHYYSKAIKNVTLFWFQNHSFEQVDYN